MRIFCLFHLTLFLLLIPVFAGAEKERLTIANFSKKSFSGWQEKVFQGKTEYHFVEDDQKGWVLQARSEQAASGLLHEVEVDLQKTPYLNWSWRVDAYPDVADEKVQRGDDYAGRVYVIFKTGYWFWDTRALNYVWNRNYEAGESWPNAYTANSQVLVLQSAQSATGQWRTEKRDVRADILSCFGIQVDSIMAVAIMTDTDDSKSSAVAYYGDIYFSSK